MELHDTSSLVKEASFDDDMVRIVGYKEKHFGPGNKLDGPFVKKIVKAQKNQVVKKGDLQAIIFFLLKTSKKFH